VIAFSTGQLAEHAARRGEDTRCHVRRGDSLLAGQCAREAAHYARLAWEVCTPAERPLLIYLYSAGGAA
jgi:hypothetical protein